MNFVDASSSHISVDVHSITIPNAQNFNQIKFKWGGRGVRQVMTS